MNPGRRSPASVEADSDYERVSHRIVPAWPGGIGEVVVKHLATGRLYRATYGIDEDTSDVAAPADWREILVLVHADGGACHGMAVAKGRCSGCGTAPDTQSTELWPPDKVAAELSYDWTCGDCGSSGMGFHACELPYVGDDE